MYFQGHHSYSEYLDAVQTLSPENQKRESRHMRNMILTIVATMLGVVPFLAWLVSK